MDKLFIKLLSGLILGCMTAGCHNICDHLYGLKYPPYTATTGAAKCIALPFRERQYGEVGIAQAYCTLLLPIFVVELPFEAVADTITLPYDLYRQK